MTGLWLLIPAICWVGIDLVVVVRVRLASRARLPRVPRFEDFDVLVPIYGNVRYLENVEYLTQYGRRVILCTTSGESDEFYGALDDLGRRFGFRTHRADYVPPPSTKRNTGGTIRDRVVRSALQHEVRASYVVCIDADTTTPRPLGDLVGIMHAKGTEIASVRLVTQPGLNWLVALQRYEYRLAMRLRLLLPWMLSGACHAGTAEALRAVMRRHSLFFQGNDIEVGLLANGYGFRVAHIPFEVLTIVPDTFKPWWRQRVAWAGGEFRLFIANIRFILKYPLLWIYGSVVVIALIAVRIYSVAGSSLGLLAVIGLYFAVTYAVHWRYRDRWLVIVPIYRLFYTLVIVPIGVWKYFQMSVPERNYGVIRLPRPRNHDGLPAVRHSRT
ncbi:cellulose synthase/poly-beta-1,6-N-acetylglucosamine synthase-like glycosyltransferase [Sediminihabitans luteus]|uniref:Cellulose synthase/poly-beta-1,6-N-acetylglucosamine synthase-like glycosyltransferase n=1 Tax=Sediminihabitans luteus TaxID=1138585 RepID=A0A2M9CC97_9CELL|nr:glycosyltransferase family 2 protein [Sediminihabitans luteus]PJJ68628.1 cellulose synthase/poly-beta-1,6-N-acetylglucosamine synthase-like glycosyltransferase [Sediminihabitans luteus]GII99968.1 hypothetical protein Slu03_23460 [Sediminihabitans luteus]